MDKTSTTNSKLHAIYVSVIVLLLVVIVGGAYYVHKKVDNDGREIPRMMGQNIPNGIPMRGMNMTAVTPPPLSDQQKQQLTDGTATTTTQKIFNITAGNFYFVPNAITVNKGDQVTFVVTNAGGVHDVVVDELGVKTPTTRTATTATFTFTASKSGSFVYYCSVPGHRAKGMWGTLTVK